MVFIHGGSYQCGSGNVKHYGPDFIFSHDVLLVTINYRLDALGFLCLDTEDVPGNAGLKDQVAALRWVKENIESFGGDPDNVTLFGECAGGASAALHLLSPMSKGLIERAILMSGVPICDWSLEYQPKRRAFMLGKLLGKDTTDPKELLEFLQSVPALKLIGQNPAVLTSEELTNTIIKMNHFTPVVEKDFGQEHFLTETPYELLRKGIINDVDVFMGHTNEESLLVSDTIAELAEKYNRYHEMVVPRKILIRCTPDIILKAADRIREYYFGTKAINKQTFKEFVKYMNATTFLYDIYSFADKLNGNRKKKTFFYVFSCLSDFK